MDVGLQPQVELTVTDADLQLIDTHAHLHFNNFAGQVDEVMSAAHEAGVSRIITVGTSTDDSRKAVNLASTYDQVWVTVGIHPHEADEAVQGIAYIRDLARHRKVVALGECGLDFYKSTADPAVQERALRLQIEAALEVELPVVFHVREAFDEFFRIIDAYPETRGVVHSFTAGPAELEKVLERNLIIGLNGITTFGNNEGLAEVVRTVPLDKLILETDCPFLSPAPHRGKRNEPARLTDIAQYIAAHRQISIDGLARQTTRVAESMFGL